MKAAVKECSSRLKLQLKTTRKPMSMKPVRYGRWGIEGENAGRRKAKTQDGENNMKLQRRETTHQ